MWLHLLFKLELLFADILIFFIIDVKIFIIHRMIWKCLSIKHYLRITSKGAVCVNDKWIRKFSSQSVRSTNGRNYFEINE